MLAANVSLPTLSYTTGTIAPPVMRLTSAGQLAMPHHGMGGAMRPRQFGLLLAGHHADHGGAEVLRPLAQDQPDAAGRGMHHDRVAGLHREGAPDQVLRGQPLQHHRRPVSKLIASGSFTSRSAAITRSVA